MRVEKISGTEERRILTAMIVDKIVLARLAARWPKQDGLFATSWANLVGGWCIKYFNQYGQAPQANIEGLFHNWTEHKKRDKETTQLINKLLSGLSDEYKTLAKASNPEFTLDLAGKYFNRVRLRRLVDGIEGDLDAGEEKQAEERLSKALPIELGSGGYVDVVNDTVSLKASFENRTEPLIIFKGGLGEFFGGCFERDGFIAYMGPEKRGKSWMLMDVVLTATIQRRRVAYFQVGDMSQDQVLRRLATRVARRPLKPKTVKYPISIGAPVDGPWAAVEHEDREFKEGLDWQGAIAAFRNLATKKIKSDKDYLRLSTHPNSSINVAGIRSLLYQWAQQGWVADIVVIDYADILAPPFGQAESRDQINATWKQMRALSQEFHCCVVTATQSDAASYETEALGRRNFSEDKRKYAHVTGMIAINVTDAEKERGLTRLGWLQLREEDFSVKNFCHLAGCLALANPAIKSIFIRT